MWIGNFSNTLAFWLLACAKAFKVNIILLTKSDICTMYLPHIIHICAWKRHFLYHTHMTVLLPMTARYRFYICRVYNLCMFLWVTTTFLGELDKCYLIILEANHSSNRGYHFSSRLTVDLSQASFALHVL